jgi:putative membrane protein
MKTFISMIALIAGLSLAGAALAQDPPAGGPDAKGNAPIKQTHTVNDGAAKTGANSFTQGEARQHILNSGYTSVSGLAKGKDGVWRGTAEKDGVSRSVALDFKGNVSDGGPMAGADTSAMTASPSSSAQSSTTRTTTTESPTSGASSASESSSSTDHAMRHRRRHHGRHHHGKVSCANPAPNGAACSGKDRNRNGISDKEDHAINAGAKP